MGVLTKTVDIHGMTVEQGKKYLEQQLNSISKDYGNLCVIHGYHAGNKLQQMVRKGLSHKRISRRMLSMNNGETILVLTEK